MSDVVVKRVEEFDSPNGGGFCRARAGLGVTSFGLQVEHFPPHFEHFPEHDHLDDGQEEVYTALAGSATLHAEGQTHTLAPGVFARVGPGVKRKITTGDEAVELLAIGAVPGRPYAAPAFTEEGAPLPG
ncbi:MAG TPA: cupin domain-containing protein [Solirubrobacteraceae bacterium]|nr:cupin domain-containing protein [Solirubrobacteraceae bacterium]